MLLSLTEMTISKLFIFVLLLAAQNTTCKQNLNPLLFTQGREKMSSDHRPLHIFFFPFLAHGHIIPTVDMAKLFAAKGIKATIITTPINAPLISKAIGNSKTLTHNNEIHIQTIKFPSVEVGLPKGCENINSLPSLESFPIFFRATRELQEPLEQILHD